MALRFVIQKENNISHLSQISHKLSNKEHEAYDRCLKLLTHIEWVNTALSELSKTSSIGYEKFEGALMDFLEGMFKVRDEISYYCTRYGKSAKIELDLNGSNIALGYDGEFYRASLRRIKIAPALSKFIDDLLQKVKTNNRRVHAQDDMERAWLKPKEAAKMLGVSYRTLWRWWKEGKINALQLPSGHLRYYKNEIEQLAKH
jgi:excisionase family DNA binding protein